MAGTGLVHDVVVTQRGGQSITIDFDLEPVDLQKDPGLVAEVLASFEWV